MPDIEVVQLFAILHDSQRVNEGGDPDHGPRAAAFALDLRGLLFDLPDHEFRLLHRACAGHTHERTHPNVTIQTCWDADRLDLGRVGITPHPSRLCTDAAKRPDILKWADGRATSAWSRSSSGRHGGSIWGATGDGKVSALPDPGRGSSGSERGHQ